MQNFHRDCTACQVKTSTISRHHDIMCINNYSAGSTRTISKTTTGDYVFFNEKTLNSKTLTGSDMMLWNHNWKYFYFKYAQNTFLLRPLPHIPSPSMYLTSRSQHLWNKDVIGTCENGFPGPMWFSIGLQWLANFGTLFRYAHCTKHLTRVSQQISEWN